MTHHPHQTQSHSLPGPRCSMRKRPSSPYPSLQAPAHHHRIYRQSRPNLLSLLLRDPVAAVITDHATRHWAIPCAFCPSCVSKGPLNRGSRGTCLRIPFPLPLPGSSGMALIQSIRRSCSNTVSLSPHPGFPKLHWSQQGLEGDAPFCFQSVPFPESLPHSCQLQR